MQYRVYDRQTLTYKDGGYVQSHAIDDDYIVNNNSTLSVVKKRENTLSDVVSGDVIVLIENSGAYHKGVITAVDDTARTISYKSDKELFNDNVLNAFIKKFVDADDLEYAGRFGIKEVVAVLRNWFDKNIDGLDPLKGLPITFFTDGDVLDESGNTKMLWSWKNDSINLVDWLTELFTTYNVSLSWTIDFNIAGGNPDDRNPQYVCTVSAITNSGGIIKDNVAMQTIQYTAKELPDATVCYVIDSETKDPVGTYYLYEESDWYSISENMNETDKHRVLPVRSIITTYNSSNTEDNIEPKMVAQEKLIPSKFNQAIEIKINSDSKMFDFETTKFGDGYTIINEHGTIDSIYTGRKSTSDNKWTTLYFGLGRQNYTDLMQIRLRKERYQEVYNG